MQILANRLISSALSVSLELTAQEPNLRGLQQLAMRDITVFRSQLLKIRSQLHQAPTRLP